MNISEDDLPAGSKNNSPAGEFLTPLLQRGILYTTSSLESLFDTPVLIEAETADSLRTRLQCDGIVCRPITSGVSSIAIELAAGPHAMPRLLVVPTEIAGDLESDILHLVSTLRTLQVPFATILIGEEQAEGSFWEDDEIAAVVPQGISAWMLCRTIGRAFNHLKIVRRAQALEAELDVRNRHLQELNRIGMALSSERELDTLLEMILTKSRLITVSDASSLYLVEPDPQGGARLRFKLSQNESLTFSVDRPMPISSDSLAGYVALTGEILQFEDVYDLPARVPFSFNRSYDESTGYRTKSMLVLPMRNHNDDIIGVLQLINRKTAETVKLTDTETVEREVLPFSSQERELANSIASQAAVAIENSALYRSIENLFEGFVTASARAIEQRDPTTSGHSERVAILTRGVAEALTQVEQGPFAEVNFSPQEIKELQYAALLHDFGKVGVREDVLLKRNKLHEYEFDLLDARFDYVRALRERDAARRKVQALLEDDSEETRAQFTLWDDELAHELDSLKEFTEIIRRANDPTLQSMSDEAYQKQQAALARMRHVFFLDHENQTRPLLTDHELRALSIRRGSLDDEERREIERHVTHTWEFLVQIPWTREFSAVPEIAHCHHERCNGTGYPRGLGMQEIPLQTRIMTIVDIYDALTASDRPYKKACTPERAIEILRLEARDGHIDADLLDVFINSNAWKLTNTWRKRIHDDVHPGNVS
jgi:HD-GYP domain-containing protein (c-di-GMP phosphodiesterase class II)